jgi:transcriptional regulator with XRE-family HTH domain
MDFKEIDKIEMGRRIKARRLALNMNRERVALELGVTAKFISAIENGDKGVSVENLYKLKQLLGVSMDFLVEGDPHYFSEEDERKKLSENIIGSLSACSVSQLGCMEQIAKIYVASVSGDDK